jgi:hypothetical protein
MISVSQLRGGVITHDRPIRGGLINKGDRPMIALAKDHQSANSTWQERFVTMLPEIECRLRNAFQNLTGSSRDEAVCEGVAHCVLAYARLDERGCAQHATPFTLVHYSARRVRCGRPAGGHLCSTDPLSRYAQIRNGIRIELQQTKWIEELVEDKRASIPDQVATKLDMSAWFDALPSRTRQIAKDLAVGSSTSELARKYKLSAGRISQFRRSLEKSWNDFQREAALAAAC